MDRRARGCGVFFKPSVAHEQLPRRASPRLGEHRRVVRGQRHEGGRLRLDGVDLTALVRKDVRDSAHGRLLDGHRCGSVRPRPAGPSHGRVPVLRPDEALFSHRGRGDVNRWNRSAPRVTGAREGRLPADGGPPIAPESPRAPASRRARGGRSSRSRRSALRPSGPGRPAATGTTSRAAARCRAGRRR